MKIRIAIALGLVHLALVVVGGSQMKLGESVPAKLFRYYGALSGASADYAFFAPGVNSPLRASFYLTDEKGETIREGTDGSNREVSIRLGDIAESFRDKLFDEKLRRSLAASWSA